MSLKDLKDKDASHLKADLAEKQKHLFELRSQAVTEKLEDPTQLRKTRKEIARLHTVLRQREIEAAKNAAPATATPTATA